MNTKMKGIAIIVSLLIVGSDCWGFDSGATKSGNPNNSNENAKIYSRHRTKGVNEKKGVNSGARNCPAHVLKGIESHIQNMKTFSAKFIQVEKKGGDLYGDIKIQKPGKLKIQYLKPKNILLLLKGEKLLHYDYELEESTYIPAHSRAIVFLAKSTFNIDKDVSVIGCEKERNHLDIMLKMKDGGVSKGNISERKNDPKNGNVNDDNNREGGSAREVDSIYLRFDLKSTRITRIGSLFFDSKSNRWRIYRLLLLNDIRINHPISDSEFVFRDPKF